MRIAIGDIRIGKRLRGLREATVNDLVDSIGRLGLRVPVSVVTGIEKRKDDADGVSFTLVAGAHRLEACRRLGWPEIDAAVVQMDGDECLLWEIDENLCRADLTELERGEHLLKRKAVYERLHPQTKAGAAQAAGMNRAIGNDVAANLAPTFVPDAADKTGASETAIKRSIRRATKIDEKVRDRIRDNPEIADSGVELDALAGMEPQQQRRAVALVEAGQAAGIRDAKKLIEQKAPKVSPHFKEAEITRQKRRDAFIRAWNALDDEDREWALAQIDHPVADNAPALRVIG